MEEGTIRFKNIDFYFISFFPLSDPQVVLSILRSSLKINWYFDLIN